jgi:L-asparaginase/Glu-tRNA(Gln) amidotransferase subunit D
MTDYHVLVTHGTDTMAWGLAYLTYALKHVPCNVALTGSQVSLAIGFKNSDAPANLRTAVQLLASVRPPSCFAVFNRGTVAFSGSLHKIDRWRPDAFGGDEAVIVRDDEFVALGRQMRVAPAPARFDLYLLRTGGTIESERNTDGLLVPTGNLVSAFLAHDTETLFRSLHPIEVCGRDSSDMTPDMWRTLSAAIVEVARGRGAARAHVDDAWSPRVGIVYLDPWKTEDDYRVEFERYEGVIVAGYGGGNGNLLTESGRSVRPAVRRAIGEGKPVVLASQVAMGITDFEYANGYLLLQEDGAVTGASLSLAHAQSKLSYLLGHREALETASRTSGIPWASIVDRCITAGVRFRTKESRLRYSRLRGFEPLTVDPFVGVPFARALAQVATTTTTSSAAMLADSELRTSSELVRALRRLSVGDVHTRRNFALVLKPDHDVGNVHSGQPVNAARNLAALLDTLLGLKPLVVNLRAMGLEGFAKAVHEVAPSEPWPVFARRFGLVAVEGGGQSVWDPGSFDEVLPRDAYLDLIEGLCRERVAAGAHPGLFVCLGHQGYAATLVRWARRLMGADRATLVEAASSVSPSSGAAVQRMLLEADRIAEGWRSFSDTGAAIAASLDDPRAAVHRNGKREALTIDVRPYRIGNTHHDWPAPLVAAHELVAGRYRTVAESALSVPDFTLSMLHGDEVDEGAVLFANWFFSSLDEALAAGGDVARLLGAAKLPEVLRGLPIGCEILASTHYRDFVEQSGDDPQRLRNELEEDVTLTEVAAMSVYYRASGGEVVSDTTVQFHPELLGVDRIYTSGELAELPLGQVSDGLRFLVALGLGGGAVG